MRWPIVLFGCALAFTTSVPLVGEEPGVGERIGEKIDQGIEKISDSLSKGWSELRGVVDKLGVEGRVYSRIHWDRDLNAATIRVAAQPNGVVTLRGAVPASAKPKALELARETVGVTAVVDELTVGGK